MLLHVPVVHAFSLLFTSPFYFMNILHFIHSTVSSHLGCWTYHELCCSVPCQPPSPCMSWFPLPIMPPFTLLLKVWSISQSLSNHVPSLLWTFLRLPHTPSFTLLWHLTLSQTPWAELQVHELNPKCNPQKVSCKKKVLQNNYYLANMN